MEVKIGSYVSAKGINGKVRSLLEIKGVKCAVVVFADSQALPYPVHLLKEPVVSKEKSNKS